jgi:Caspase domain
MKYRWAIIVASGIAVCATLAFLSRAAIAQPKPSSRQLQQVEPVKTWPSKTKRWALLIGVDKYSDPQISPLKGADNDARTLSDALVRYAGFPQDQVILLSTDQPTERQPTRINILRRLSNLASVVPKDGLLLISFAGHGIERGGQAYLIPSDSQISDDINLLEESAVSVARMKDRIRATGVGQVVILLDACRNDPGGRADAPNPLTTAYVNAFNFDVRNHEVTAFATIYATAVGQRAYEYTEKKQGYFTWAVVEGLKGGAANDQGEVTLAKLIKYVQEAVPKRVAIDLGSSRQQRPFSQMEGYKADELVIAVARKVTANTKSSTFTGVDPTAIELSYWETIKNSNNPDDFKSYLEKYPDGQFIALAKNKITEIDSANSAVQRSGDDGTELAFWDSVKNSSSADDLRLYLKRYPNGTFAQLAENRIKTMVAAVMPPKDLMEGSWVGASPGRDKKYDLQFSGDGRVMWKMTMGRYQFVFKGTWKRSGNVVSMELEHTDDASKTEHIEGTVTGNKFEGTYGKYRFITEKTQ